RDSGPARARSNHQTLSGFNLQGQSQEMRVTGLSRSPVRREALGPTTWAFATPNVNQPTRRNKKIAQGCLCVAIGKLKRPQDIFRRPKLPCGLRVKIECV
ncbi:MAG TPA: hypothetical protein VIH54_06755, partial [Chthoniobacterales bacterium]